MTENQLRMLAEDWFEDLRDKMGEESFIASVKLARQRCKFMPKTADILAAFDGEIATGFMKLDSDVIMVEEGPTYKSDFDIEKSKKKLEILGMVAGGEIGYEEGIKKISEIDKGK